MSTGTTVPYFPSAVKTVQLNKEITLLPAKWLVEFQQATAVRASVTSAHRALISERDDAAVAYLEQLGRNLEQIQEDYGRLLSQEASWSERWNRQVKMLKRGNL
jgi:hypothetical protein